MGCGSSKVHSSAEIVMSRQLMAGIVPIPATCSRIRRSFFVEAYEYAAQGIFETYPRWQRQISRTSSWSSYLPEVTA